MDKDFLYKHAPLLVVSIALVFQYNLFVTPAKLEQTHREILSEISQVYITKSEFGNMKEQIADINKKVDKIYDTLINERKSNGINKN
jgi:cell division protein FtsL